MFVVWVVVSLVCAAALAIGMQTRSDLLKIIGLGPLFVWVPVAGPVFAWLGFRKRREARLLEAFAMDRPGLRSARMASTFLMAEHRDGRRLELDCGGMLMSDAQAIAAYLNEK